MRAILEEVLFIDKKLINVFKYSTKYFEFPWHFHPEYELVLILRGKGTRFVGDSVESFVDNDLVFLDSNLPHVWKSDKNYYKQDSEFVSECIVIQFRDNIFPAGYEHLNEFSAISELLTICKHGLKIEGRIKQELIKNIIKISNLEGIDRLTLFLLILQTIALSKDSKKLSSNNFFESYSIPKIGRLQKVYDFVLDNYRNNISIDEISEIANMNKSAFCRYFKQKVNKTFTQFVNEIRIGCACRMLIEGEYNIAQICYDSGFNNIANFNRQFKSIMSMKPSEYKTKHETILEKGFSHVY